VSITLTLHCCGASEQQHKQDLRILELTTFYHNALHLTRLHCATYYQSASRHEQHEDVTPSKLLESLRIDDFFHDDDVGTAESPTTHVQRDVAQD